MIKIDGGVVCLSFACHHGEIWECKADEFTSEQCVFSFMSRIRCYVLSISLYSRSLGNNFPIVLSGEV